MVTQPADGGVFEHVRRLATGIQRRGHEVVVAGPLGGRHADLGVDVEEVELVRSVAPGADARAAWSLARAVRRVRPDLIHAHSSKAGALGAVGRAGVRGDTDVYTPHGYAFAGVRERAGARLVPEGRAGARAAHVDRALRLRGRARLAAQVGPAPHARSTTAFPRRRPVPPHPSAERASRDGPVVGLVTLLRPGKGIETLIDALPDLLASPPAGASWLRGRA